jgi:hypothetical protein
MAQNTAPIFAAIPKINWAAGVTAANTAKDGTGTVDTVFTADALDGSYVLKLVARPKGTNVASVLRVFINNGSANTTAANNVLFAELSLPATTLSEVAALSGVELPLNIPMPIGYKLNVTLGTAVAAGWAVTVIGGDY